MGLFKRKPKDEDKSTVKNTATETTVEKKGPSIHNVKLPEQTETSVAKTSSQKATSTPKAAPVTGIKSSAKPTSTVKKAPATKTVAKSPAKATAQSATSTAVKPSAKASAPKKVAATPTKTIKASELNTTAIPIIPRPFFVKTEEDVRLAFDEAIAAADAQILKNGAKAIGKYEFELEVDGFHFYLVANNGQILFDSPGFTTLIGALKGVDTFKKTVANGNFEIRADKYDRYRFILEHKYYGENYTTREQCQKCVESVKNFADNAKIIRYTPTKEAVNQFEAAKNSKRRPDDIDWKAVEQAEKTAAKMGKFEICREEDQYTFYLIANNGQILYSSRYYANEAAARKGVDSFKRAAYVGNFFVDRDKFGNYRYVLKNIGSAPAFIGESYDNKPQCEKIIDSVKKFIVSASVELESEAK